jgi:repressor LexA
MHKGGWQMARQLSLRQKAILRFISETTADRGYPPTVREIGNAVGLRSSSSVHHQLKALQREGYLTRDGNLTRALRITADAPLPARARPAFVPLVGRVAAGRPILAEENIQDMLPLPAELLSAAADSFLLKVEGDSMVEKGILDGDYVIVRQQPVAEDGDVVVALLGDEATVKTFYRRGDQIELRPANAAMQPILATDVQILGRVTGVVRAL